MSSSTGIVADIQRYSLHDGPGIRTSVFLKGCNMNCAWCHNPETISLEPQYLIDEEKCIACGFCDEGCFSGARILCGKEMSIEEIMDIVMLDALYYGDEGGITVTGGEPTVQADFARDILRAAKARGLHTAIETNMLSPWPRIKMVLEHVDLIMADLKIFDRELHKKWTGVYNDRIKVNLLRASEAGIPLILRTPVIEDINASEEEISNIADFASKLPSLVYYEMLPYHKLGLSKGMLEGFVPREFERPSNETFDRLSKLAKSKAIDVRLANIKI